MCCHALHLNGRVRPLMVCHAVSAAEDAHSACASSNCRFFIYTSSTPTYPLAVLAWLVNIREPILCYDGW